MLATPITRKLWISQLHQWSNILANSFQWPSGYAKFAIVMSWNCNCACNISTYIYTLPRTDRTMRSLTQCPPCKPAKNLKKCLHKSNMCHLMHFAKWAVTNRRSWLDQIDDLISKWSNTFTITRIWLDGTQIVHVSLILPHLTSRVYLARFHHSYSV